MNINAITNGDRYVITVKCDDKDYPITFYLAEREGSNPEMVKSTVRHFIEACRRAAQGEITASEDFDDKVGKFGKSTHGEAHCSIWAEKPGIPVLLEDGMRFIQVNVFTEETSVAGWLQHAYNHIAVMAEICGTGIVKLKSDVRTYAPKQQSPQAQRGTAQAQPQQPAVATPQQEHDEEQAPEAEGQESPYLGGYNYKLKEDYAKYAGQTVRFDVMKMVRKFDDRDGSPLVQVYSSYNNALSKYPALDLKVKPNRLEKVDEFTKPILEAILEGAEINNHYQGSFYMFAPDDGNGKLYPVLTKLTLTGQTQPESGSEQPEYEPNPADEIPF